MSGKYLNDEHPPNNPLILIILLKFHFEILDNSFIDEHNPNNSEILLALLKSQFEISGKSFNEEHP